MLKVHHPCHAPPADRRETQDRKGETLCRGDRGQQVLGPGTRGGRGQEPQEGELLPPGPRLLGAAGSSSPHGGERAQGPVIQPPTPGATRHIPGQNDFESGDIGPESYAGPFKY